MTETIQRLKELIISRLRLNIDADEIGEETMLFGDDGLGLDSVDILELIVAIKSEFGVEIADRETAERIFTSVGAIAQFLGEQS